MDEIHRKWTQLLINWLNKCVALNEVTLSVKCLVKVIEKYKEDVCCDDVDNTVLCADDLEPFFRYKFPALKLRNPPEVIDHNKLYIMASVLLYYCCMHTKTCRVDADICERLNRENQQRILKFCEALSKMEVTMSNVDRAIKVACEPQKSKNNYEIPVYSKNPMGDQKGVKSLEDDPNSLTGTSSSIGSDATSKANVKNTTVLQFKSSVTILPSAVTDTSISTPSASEFQVSYIHQKVLRGQKDIVPSGSKDTIKIQSHEVFKDSLDKLILDESSSRRNCQPDCDCTRCSADGPCCGDPGCSKDMCKDITEEVAKQSYINWKLVGVICSGLLLVIIVVLSAIAFWIQGPHSFKMDDYNLRDEFLDASYPSHYAPDWSWECKKDFCHKVFRPATNENIYTSLSRCTLLCMGPQLWPYPIGYTYFSKTIVLLSTNKLEYKFQSVPSDSVHLYLGEAFKLFLKDLIRLEKVHWKPKNKTKDLSVKKMIIQIDVESDPDPRLRLNTEEAYTLKVETNKDNQVLIKISSVSFCGVRHGLETLSQVILRYQSTGYLVTLSNIIIKDAPSYKYRGLMIDTGRNFIPVIDLMRTIDAMATCKLNTFHWRISDATSFPLQLMNLPEFDEYGPYGREMVYTKEDVKSIVNRASIRGIRVLIEVAAPGPVGRPWSWSPDATCPKKTDNSTCDDVLCLRLSMQETAFDVLETIYSEILEMTNVEDIFHLSDGVFSLIHCYDLVDDREGFLDKALVRLKLANKGFLPKLPIIWYTSHLTRDLEAKTWDRLGVQLSGWDPDPEDSDLSKFKVIHSTKCDLSCEMRNQRCTKYRYLSQSKTKAKSLNIHHKDIVYKQLMIRASKRLL